MSPNVTEANVNDCIAVADRMKDKPEEGKQGSVLVQQMCSQISEITRPCDLKSGSHS